MITVTVGAVRARTAPLADGEAHRAAEALGQAWFGPNFDETCFDEWASRCEEILFVAVDADSGEFLGYADQMLLAPWAAAALRAGTITEAEFGPDAVLSDEAVAHLPPGSDVTLYLAGMCVVAPGTAQGRDAARALRACRRELVSRWRARGLTVRALLAAATGAGRTIATRAGGLLVGAADTRRDGYDLYELTDLPSD